MSVHMQGGGSEQSSAIGSRCLAATRLMTTAPAVRGFMVQSSFHWCTLAAFRASNIAINY
ncbi:MAG: hypothetical protein OJF50_005737 [Nitrospira sp.]|nr:hypothetical protein [Nitrospira sp.]